MNLSFNTKNVLQMDTRESYHIDLNGKLDCCKIGDGGIFGKISFTTCEEPPLWDSNDAILFLRESAINLLLLVSSLKFYH
jgi:hypothetical protein